MTNFNLTITITASDDLMQLLKALVGKESAQVTSPKKETVKKDKPEASATPEKTTPESVKKVEIKPETTLEALRSQIAEKSKTGGEAMRPLIVGLLKEYGVSRATDLPVEEYGNFIVRLKALKVEE